ncbi:S24/S26 family peptidase [Candidatus Poribacteria bacterium]
MRSQISKPAVSDIKEGELSLSRQVLVELIQAVFAKGALFRFRAKGSSMHPFIRNGDLVTISPLSDTSLRIGDVVAFIRPGRGNLVIHRVVRKIGDSLSIKGDNGSPGDGEIVPRAKILGRVTRVERNGKEVLLGFGSERLLIAFLNRNALLAKFLPCFVRFFRPIFRRK